MDAPWMGLLVVFICFVGKKDIQDVRRLCFRRHIFICVQTQYIKICRCTTSPTTHYASNLVWVISECCGCCAKFSKDNEPKEAFWVHYVRGNLSRAARVNTNLLAHSASLSATSTLQRHSVRISLLQPASEQITRYICVSDKRGWHSSRRIWLVLYEA